MSVLTIETFTACDLLNAGIRSAVQIGALPHQLFHVLVFGCLGTGLKMGRSPVQGILPKSEKTHFLRWWYSFKEGHSTWFEEHEL